MDAKAEKLALFRYGLIAPLVIETLPRGELTRRAQEIAARHYDIPDSKRISVSVDTLLDWALRYRTRRLRGPGPQTAPGPRPVARHHPATRRPDRTPQTRKPASHRHHPVARTGPVFRHRTQPGVSASTLYRFLKQRGLSERQLLAPHAHKKFEAELSNQIWQADMLFGPYVQRPGGGKMQAFLHATLDDASRLIPHAQFYPSQGLDACLDCLRQAIAARGVPVRLYIDNAKIYRSPATGPHRRLARHFDRAHSVPISPRAAAKSSATFAPSAISS